MLGATPRHPRGTRGDPPELGVLLLLLILVMLREGFCCQCRTSASCAAPRDVCGGRAGPGPGPVLPAMLLAKAAALPLGRAAVPALEQHTAGLETAARLHRRGEGGPGSAHQSFDWKETCVNPDFLPSVCFVTNLYT